MAFERPPSGDRPRTAESRPRTGESRRSDYDDDDDDDDEDNEFEDYIDKHRPALWRAAMEDKVQFVIDVITSVNLEFAGTAMPPVINWQDERGQTVLHMACLCKSYNTAFMLLDKGADFHFPSDNGATPHVCVADPAKREELRQKAFDVSPEGLIYWAQVLVDEERGLEAESRHLMGIEDQISEEVEQMEIDRIERERQFHAACRAKYIKMVVDRARYYATERIIAVENMGLCDNESKEAWAYERYLQEVEAERVRQEKLAVEEARQQRAEAAFRAEREALLRQRAIDGRRARYAQFVEMKRLEEEAEQRRLDEAAAEEARLKYEELCRHLERLSTSQGIRLKYDKPRRLTMYQRMRLGVHMASCNTVNYNTGLKTLDPRHGATAPGELPPLRSASDKFFSEMTRSPCNKTPMPSIKEQV